MFLPPQTWSFGERGSPPWSSGRRRRSFCPPLGIPRGACVFFSQRKGGFLAVIPCLPALSGGWTFPGALFETFFPLFPRFLSDFPMILWSIPVMVRRPPSGRRKGKTSTTSNMSPHDPEGIPSGSFFTLPRCGGGRFGPVLQRAPGLLPRQRGGAGARSLRGAPEPSCRLQRPLCTHRW